MAKSLFSQADVTGSHVMIQPITRKRNISCDIFGNTLITAAYCCWLYLLPRSLVKSEGYQPLCPIITTKSKQNDTANEKDRAIKDEWGTN